MAQNQSPAAASRPTRLIIARHGNTFDKGDVVTRVGAGTDLPLSTSGQKQAQKLGECLAQRFPEITQVFTSTLKRTAQTAETIARYFDRSFEVQALSIFNEIDYGPDENRPEAEVIHRLGKQAIDDWDTKARVPAGWKVNPEHLTQMWQTFLQQLSQQYPEQTVLVITSNGVARFILNLVELPDAPTQSIKLATSAYGVLELHKKDWLCRQWNIKP